MVGRGQSCPARGTQRSELRSTRALTDGRLLPENLLHRLDTGMHSAFPPWSLGKPHVQYQL